MNVQRILVAVALATAGAVSVTSASAQVQAPGWFGSLTGWYIVDGLDTWQAFRGRPEQGVGDGWGGRGYVGYRFSNPWDLAVGVQYDRTSWGKSDSAKRPEYLRHRALTVDGELGYNFAMNGVGVRAFAGVRYFDARFEYRDTDPSRSNVDSWAVGPRIGIDATYNFAGTAFSLFGGVSGAVMFGKIQERTVFDWFCDSCEKDNLTSFAATGELGVGYEIAPMTKLALGYRVDANWGSNYNIHDATGNGSPDGKGSTIVHGPFVRVSYNIGAPRAMPIPAPAPQPAAVMAKNFIVFFDFDRADLTPQSRATIKQAADASKTGGVQRVGVTGHADKSGPDAYNMALSLRRANNVKDELVRDGVPAASIVVVGRGESQPLVPTADGVREPQNRRVEIVLQ